MMRTLLLLSLLFTGVAETSGQAPTPRPAQPAPKPAQPAPKPAQPAPKPAQPAPTTPAAQRPAPRRAQPANTRSGMAITVTDPQGGTLDGIRVQILGASEREATTNDSGQVNFPGLQAGAYRLRFSGDAVITFEREVTLRAGQVADVDVTLNPAPASAGAVAPVPPPAAAAPAAEPGPTGEPLTLNVPEVLEQNFVGTQPRRETLLSCSGNTRTTMIQLNMPLPDRLYETADAAYYVIGGEGAVRIAGRETKLATNGYVSIPRNTPHSFAREGRRPLILLAVLSGEVCEQAK